MSAAALGVLYGVDVADDGIDVWPAAGHALLDELEAARGRVALITGMRRPTPTRSSSDSGPTSASESCDSAARSGRPAAASVRLRCRVRLWRCHGDHRSSTSSSGPTMHLPVATAAGSHEPAERPTIAVWPGQLSRGSRATYSTRASPTTTTPRCTTSSFSPSRHPVPRRGAFHDREDPPVKYADLLQPSRAARDGQADPRVGHARVRPAGRRDVRDLRPHGRSADEHHHPGAPLRRRRGHQEEGRLRRRHVRHRQDPPHVRHRRRRRAREPFEPASSIPASPPSAETIAGRFKVIRFDIGATTPRAS